MGVLLAIVVIAALTVTMAATLVTNHTIWNVWREQRREWRGMPPEKRHRMARVMTLWWVSLLAYTGAVLVAPWGARHTITYLVIVPGVFIAVVVAPIATIVVGVRAGRRARRREAGSGTIRRR